MPRVTSFVALAAVCFGCADARAQPCAIEWSDEFSYGVFNGEVRALVEFDDDGPGPNPPALFIGGHFSAAGGVAANRIVKWDGSAFTSLGSGLSDWVSGLAVYDEDGPGPALPALFVGGIFRFAGGSPANRIAKWDGQTWSAVGGGMNASGYRYVTELLVFDEDGTGPNPPFLFAGGNFTTAGGVPATGIARWGGSSWSPVGTGIAGGILQTVGALAEFDDDGPGPNPPSLIAGGSFSTAGGVAVNGIAKWDGAAWSSLAGGVTAAIFPLVEDITIFDDDGPGPNPAVLIAGGHFEQAGGVSVDNVARWDGSAWSGLGGGITGGEFPDVHALAAWDVDGLGPNTPRLFAAGRFEQSDGQPSLNMAQWDGLQWTPLGTGLNSTVQFLHVFDVDGIGPELPNLFVGGGFTVAGGVRADSLARWTGSSWLPIVPGPVDNGVNSTVRDFAVFDEDGAGAAPPSLFVAGSFLTSGPVRSRRIARWDGANWSALTTAGGTVGVNGIVEAVAVFDDDDAGPNPPALFVAGSFTTAGALAADRIAKWNGANWSPLGQGLDSTAQAMAVFDPDSSGPTPPALIVAGSFTTAGGISANRVAMWDGQTWSALGDGFNAVVYTLAVYDEDGSGPAPPRLFAGGDFVSSGAVTLERIARWDGVSWTDVGGGVSSRVYSLAVFDPDAMGPIPPALVAGGFFLRAGGMPANRIAQWNGQSWQTLGSGVDNGSVDKLVEHDSDGPGPEQAMLYVGGGFSSAGGVPATNIAQWDGNNWSPLDSGLAESTAALVVSAMASYDDDGPGPNPPSLFAGGQFTTAGGRPSGNIARWGCPKTAFPDMNCDGSVNDQDIAPFAVALVDPALYAVMFPACDISRADVNQDGVNDGLDVAPFVAIILQS